MRYTPKEIDDGIRVTPGSQLKDLLAMLLGLGILLVGIYVLLGLAVDWAAERMSPEMERKLGRRFVSGLVRQQPVSPREQALRELFDRLPVSPELPELPYTVRLLEDPQANAAALPGGTIFVFTGLLDETASENELVFVLAHELGHYADRDHLKGLGRALVLFTISTALLGDDSSAGGFFLETLATTDLRFSREQESRADRFALTLLDRFYGHAGGVTDFLDRAARREAGGRFRYFFATHPHPAERVRDLNDLIEARGMPRQTPAPVPPELHRQAP